MGKTKQGQAEDRLETQEDPVPVLAGGANVEPQAKHEESKKGGLRSQGEVKKTDAVATEGKGIVAPILPGNLRSQGAVALAKQADTPSFSNVHMRSTAAKKAAGTSTHEQADVAPATPNTGPVAPQLSEDESRSAPNASDLDATLPEATQATPQPMSKPVGRPMTSKIAVAGHAPKPSKRQANVVKAAPIQAPASETKAETAVATSVPKKGTSAAKTAPIISLKVAVKMDEATLVMNPKSNVKLDDAAAVVAPEAKAKSTPAAPVEAAKVAGKAEKGAQATRPNVAIIKDKASNMAAPKQDTEAAKAKRAPTPTVGIKTDKKETVEAEPDLGESKEGEAALEGMDLSEAEGDDLQDTTERTHQRGSLSERRHRRTRELRTQHEGKADPSV